MSKTLAPAKLNLRLAVLGRRADGYHDVDTWMVPLANLRDVVTISARGADGAGVSGGPLVRCPGWPDLETPENLAARAARGYAAAAAAAGRALPPGALDLVIEIEKWIPAEAGLGGGSSDAAAVLRLMEKKHAALGPAALASVAAGIGADVAFFLRGEPAHATGRGENLAPGEWPTERWAALAGPASGLRTAEVYARADVLGAQARGAARGAGFFNDLEAAALDLCPAIAPLLVGLRGAGATVAQVSGSGSACFGLFADEATAEGGARAAESAGAAWTFVSFIGRAEPA